MSSSFFSGGNLTTIFATVAIDVSLFVWMHFTVSGNAFGAAVASTLGVTEAASQASGLVAATPAPVDPTGGAIVTPPADGPALEVFE